MRANCVCVCVVCVCVLHVRAVYPAVVRRGLQLGTTTVAYYGTIHAPATKLLAGTPRAHGMTHATLRTTHALPHTTHDTTHDTRHDTTRHDTRRATQTWRAETAARYGQRAFVGKVCMDRNSPAHYVETTADSLRDTAHFCEEVLAMGDPLITPILTPRYLPLSWACACVHVRVRVCGCVCGG
jgi:cytosine/adenosine deaminase-related metal-dependent hydrolase